CVVQIATFLRRVGNEGPERRDIMKVIAFVAAILALLVSGCGTDRVQAEPLLSLQQQISVGGTVALPAGTFEIDCSSQVVISKTTAVFGQGRGITIINDSCPSGDTFLVDLTKPATVAIQNLTIIHASGSGTAL